MAVVLASQVLVLDRDANGCTGGFSFEYAGEYPCFVFLLSLRGDLRLSGPSSVQLVLDESFVDVEAGRAPIDGDADGRAVRLAESADPKNSSVGITQDRKSTRLNSSHQIISYA